MSMSSSDSEFDDPDYDSFVASLEDNQLGPPGSSSSLPTVRRYVDVAIQHQDIDELVNSLERISLRRSVEPAPPHTLPQRESLPPGTPPRRQPVPPRTPPQNEPGPAPRTPPRTPPRREPVVPCTPLLRTQSRPDNTLYRVQSPTKGLVVTPHWSEAADLAQSDKDSHVVAEIRRQKSRASPQVYVVFIGRDPGVYHSWHDCKAQTAGVPSVYQGYSSHSQADAAFEYATRKGFVSRSRVGQPLALNVQAPEDNFLTDPESAFDNALNMGITRQRWYNVHQGRAPGIYRTYLECSLNVILVSGAVHESFFTLENAREEYLIAFDAGLIRVRV